jgi:CheY-like chemotaxis protein
VKDNGIGIDKEFVKDMFEPFERARTSTESGINGTGLGLAITKSIVDAMNGTIDVVTEVGKGSEFIVRLTYPVTEKQEDSEVTEEKDSSGEDLSGKRILLAEDMDINREIAVMLLEDMGFVVESAVDGKEAFDKYKSAPPGYYDLIITDIQMPVMDGYEFTKAVRGMEDTAYSGIPVIAMTANTMKEDKDKSKELGMNGHIPKPLDVEVMSETISEALRRS